MLSFEYYYIQKQDTYSKCLGGVSEQKETNKQTSKMKNHTSNKCRYK
jgi:hypothetical protein